MFRRSLRPASTERVRLFLGFAEGPRLARSGYAIESSAVPRYLDSGLRLTPLFQALG